MECVCSSLREDSEFVTLRAHPKAVSKALVSSMQLGFGALVPGMLIQCFVDKFVEVGAVTPKLHRSLQLHLCSVSLDISLCGYIRITDFLLHLLLLRLTGVV